MDNTPQNIPDRMQAVDNRICSSCDRQIAADETYLIEKAWRKYPDLGSESLIFELILCFPCLHKQNGEISKESRQNINLFLQEHISNVSGEEQCLVTGKPIAESEEIQAVALCQGNSLYDNQPVIYLSGEALEMLQNILSKETKEFLDDFSSTIFGPPAEWKDLFNHTRPILL